MSKRGSSGGRESSVSSGGHLLMHAGQPNVQLDLGFPAPPTHTDQVNGAVPHPPPTRRSVESNHEPSHDEQHGSTLLRKKFSVLPQQKERSSCFPSFGLVFYFSIVSIVLIIFAVAASTVVGSTRFQNNAEALQNSTETLVLQTTEATMAELMDQTLSRVRQWLDRIPRCAERTVEAARNGVVDPGNASELGRQLYSELVHADVVYSFMGLRDGRYKAYYRDVDYAREEAEPQRPDYVVQSTFWSFSNGSSASDYTLPLSRAPKPTVGPNSILEFQIDEEGLPLLDQDFSLLVEGWQARKRPWFNVTRHAQKPTWIPPYIWVPNLILGIDACVPYYDNSNGPKFDPAMDSPSALPSDSTESLAMVACCDTALDRLSAKLGLQNLGVHGRAFIVEVEGESEGLLLAAAGEGKPLPVAVGGSHGGLEDGHDTSSVDLKRLKAEESGDEIVAAVARFVRTSMGGWRAASRGQHTLQVNDLDLAVRVEHLDGTDGERTLDKEGNWSPEPFAVAGLRWALVMVVVRNERLEPLLESMENVDDIIAEAEQDQMMLAVALGLLGGILSFWFADVITRSLRTFRRAMEAIRQLQIYDLHQTFFFKEVSAIATSLERMGDAVKLFDKFVPKVVMEAMQAEDEERKKSARSLWTEKRLCTVLHIDAKWFDGLRGSKTSQVLDQFLHVYMDVIRKAVEQYGGTLVNNSGVQAVGFWDHDAECYWDLGPGLPKRPMNNHARSACEAALQVVKGTRTVIDRYLEEDWEVHCGVHTAPSFVGNFGSQSRIKYGVYGEACDGAAHVNALGPLLCENPAILITESTDQAVHGYFRRRLLCTDPAAMGKGSAFVFELLDRCEWVDDESKELWRSSSTKHPARHHHDGGEGAKASERGVSCWGRGGAREAVKRDDPASPPALRRSKSLALAMEEQRYQHQTQNFWVRLVLLLCVLVWSIVVAVTRRSGSIAIIAYVFASICFVLMAFASTRMWQRWRDKEKRQVPLIPHRANNGTLGNGTLPNGTLPNGTSGYRGHAQPHWGTPQQPTHNPGLQWTPSDASSAGVAQALADGGSSRRITEVSLEQMDKEPTSWWSRCEHPNCWSLRGTIMVFVLLMMSCVLATTGLIQYPPYHKTMTTLHERNAQITLDSTQSMIEELSTFSVDRLMAMVNDISLCAHRTAVDFADLRLHDGLPPLLLQRTLYSQVVRHNTTWAYMGQPDGMYTGVQRSNVPYAPSQPPRISMETTVFNSPPNGSFIQRWDVAQRAQILPSTARVVHQTYNVTGRPWFTEAVASNTLKMVSPYVWTGEYNVEIAVGIDACVPVFDDFSARKDGRLVAVTCCANHLQDLSLKMAENDIGVSYVVEAAGAGAGLLIAAAGEGKAIPVLQSIDPSEQDKHTTVGYSASGELYSRVAATESRDAMVAATSLFLLDNFGAWARVTQQFLSFSADEVKALARTPMARTDTGEAALELVRHGVDVRIRKLDGRVEGMYVDDKGRWSKDLLQAKGVDWLVVHVLPRADVGSQGLTLSTEDVRDWSVLVIILLAISLLASLFLINLVVPPLKELEKNMEVMVTHTRKDWDMDEDRPVEKISSVQDIRRMQIAFSGMQKTLAIFRKFVPSAVIAKALSVDPDVRDQAGRAWIERDKCTIVHSTLRGLDKLPEDSVGYVLVGLHKALHQAIILENGVIIDFQGGEVLSFWNKKNNAHKNHAELACLAILSQQQAVLSLLRQWAPTIPHSKHLKCTFGAYTGKMYFGNFGTSSKLVYAVESGKVSLARRLDRMNLLHDSDVLVSESTVRKVDPSLFVESPAQAPTRPNPAGTTHTAVANRALPDLAESNAEAEAEERDADNNIDIDIDNDIDAPPLPVHRNWSYDSLGFGSSGRTVGGAGSRSSMRGSKSSLRTPKSASGSNASHVPASTRFEWRHVGELIMRQKTFEGVQNPSGGKNSKMEGAAFSASRRFNIQRTGSLHAQQQAKEAKEKEAKDQNKSVQVYQLVRQVDGDGPSEDEDKDDAAVQSVDSEEEGLGAAEDYILSVQAQGSAQHSREI